MATLTLQVRLGISRGWRVRTLNNVKFYNQAIAHCLFIFSSLRARGYKDRIWTMNYTVFASGSRYSIYVEYFLLPDHSSWKRGIQQYFCSTFVMDRRLMVGQMRVGYGLNVVFKGTPHLRRIAHLRRSSRKQSVRGAKNAIWAWASRTRLLDVMRRDFLLSKDWTQAFDTMDGWALSTATRLTGPLRVSPAAPHKYTHFYGKISHLAWGQLRHRVTRGVNGTIYTFLKKRRALTIGVFGRNFKKLTSRVQSRILRKMGRARSRLNITFRRRSRMLKRTRLRVARFLRVCAARRLLWSQMIYGTENLGVSWAYMTSAHNAGQKVIRKALVKSRSYATRRRPQFRQRAQSRRRF